MLTQWQEFYLPGLKDEIFLKMGEGSYVDIGTGVLFTRTQG